jgi:diguanylate cyclase (GGDEF)-like protein
VALVIAGAFYGSVATPLLMAWFAALATLLLVRLGAPHLLAKLRLEAQLSIAVLCALVMATGIVWGVTPWLFLDTTVSRDHFIVLLMLVGIAATAIPFMACVWIGYAGFVLAILAPAFAWLVCIGGQAPRILAVMVLLYMVALLLAARHYARLQYEADHDALTALLNRRALVRRLGRLTAQPASDAHPYVLAYLELEHFKLINDIQGHMAGDEVLRQAAGVLQEHMGDRDTLARLRGDEFAILFEDDDCTRARARVEAMVRAFRECRFSWRDQVFRLDLSAGLLALDGTQRSVDELFRAADTACSAAKEAGGARVHVYHPDDGEMQRIQEQRSWANYISEALDQDRFTLFGQLIVPTQCARHPPGLDVEVLVRLPDARSSEPFTPASFMAAAERYGLAQRLDRWVIDAVFAWFRDNPGAARAVQTCAINLSGTSLDDPELTHALIRDLQGAPLAPSQLRFEITETAAIGHLAQARQFMERLRALGCRFALDDFGSGLSSFGHLRALPVNAIKIDGQFIRDIVDDHVDQALVQSIHQVARALGLQTVAEFVENDAARALLDRIGIDHVQGHYVGAAAPLDELFAPTCAQDPTRV